MRASPKNIAKVLQEFSPNGIDQHIYLDGNDEQLTERQTHMAQKEDLVYEDVYATLVELLTSKKASNKFYHDEKRKAKLAVLLIQLRNGARVAEAIRAYNQYIENGGQDQFVRVGKRGFKYGVIDGKKKRSSDSKEPEKPFFRRMVIPIEISRDLPTYNFSIATISIFCSHNLKFHTHSLRYAFIGHMSAKGYPVQTIAAITGQKTLDMVLDYTQGKKADEALDHVLDWGK